MGALAALTALLGPNAAGLLGGAHQNLVKPVILGGTNEYTHQRRILDSSHNSLQGSTGIMCMFAKNYGKSEPSSFLVTEAYFVF